MDVFLYQYAGCLLQVNVEILPEGGDSAGEMGEGEERLTSLLERGIAPPLPETVTVTLTQNPDAGTVLRSL